jgi:putative transposase
MVRAGVVKHPSEWPFCGYGEIQKPKERYALIDYKGLREAFGFREMEEFAASYREWIYEALKKARNHRDRKWTESIAVGSESFVKTTKQLLGADGRGRKVREREDIFELREETIPYSGILGHENTVLSPENRYLW